MTTKNEKINEVAAALKEHLEYGAGVITVKPEGLVKAAEGFGADLAIIKKAHDESSTIGAAVMLAAGERALDEMVKDNNISTITTEYKVGHETFVHTFKARDEVRVKPGSDETRTEYLNTTSTRTMAVNKTTFKNVREQLRGMGREGLGAKDTK